MSRGVVFLNKIVSREFLSKTSSLKLCAPLRLLAPSFATCFSVAFQFGWKIMDELNHGRTDTPRLEIVHSTAHDCKIRGNLKKLVCMHRKSALRDRWPAGYFRTHNTLQHATKNMATFLFLWSMLLLDFNVVSDCLSRQWWTENMYLLVDSYLHMFLIPSRLLLRVWKV